MRKLITLDEVEEEYFRENPDEVDEYLSVIFDEYAIDQDIGALLASLRVLARVKGICVRDNRHRRSGRDDTQRAAKSFVTIRQPQV